jgi:23S rRNA (pseudouridine1915-N3)-methyltransferase
MGVKVTIISVGKVKDKYLQLGVDEFKKRLSRFCKLELIEVKDEALSEKASDKELEIVRQREGELILNKLPDTAYVIAMDIIGKQLTSKQLADKMQHIVTYGQSQIVFIIGGSVGLSDEVKKHSDMKLSFSKMTFPHQLFKLVLLEQVYRAFKINANESYHK